MTERESRAQWAWVAVPIALAFLIYHPLSALPLDIWDFREFVPILRRTHGVMAQWGALLAYYAHHGRSNALFYLTFVIEYDLFGTNAVGWQVLRFVLMSGACVLFVAVARRMGMRTIAAVAAASLLVVSTPAVRAWVQLMGEPQALVALLFATWCAIGYATSERWRARCVGIVAGLAVVFLTKEVLGTLGVVVVVIAIGWPFEGWRQRALFAQRNVALFIAAGLVAVGEFVLLTALRAQPGATGYGMAYGTASLSVSRLGDNVAAIVMPVRPAAGALVGLRYPANIIVLVLALVGAVLFVRRTRASRSVMVSIAIALVPVIIGAVVYWPWPKFDNFYALPFFVGPLFLFAAALDEVFADRRCRLLGLLAMLAAVFYAGIGASRSNETAAASLRLNGNLAHLLARFDASDTLFILGPPDGPRALPVKPDELRDYAVAMGFIDSARAVVVRPAPCSEYQPGAPTARTYASYSYGCGRIPSSNLRLASPFTWHDWRTLAAIHDTLTVDVVGGAMERVLHQ